VAAQRVGSFHPIHPAANSDLSPPTVDKKRKELGLSALETFVIDVISAKDVALDSDDPELLKKTKMSSTFIREWVVGKQRNESGTEAQPRPA
jgi:hypothetical protein